MLTCATSQLAQFAVAELEKLVDNPVVVLAGGTQARTKASLMLESGGNRLASKPIDRYRRPYEGTDNPKEAIQGYLDWQFGLVDQLKQDGTHGFFLI